jgi:hypothetical protein
MDDFGMMGLTSWYAVCTVVTAPRNTEIIITIGKEPMPISEH